MQRETMDVAWRWIHRPGFEHLRLTRTDEGFQADSLVAGLIEGQWLRLAYTLEVDNRWVFRHLRVSRLGQTEPALDLSRHGSHEWSSNTHTLPDLSGAVDVDLSFTPFTNTLPIRRCELQEGDRVRLNTVYLPAPGFAPVLARQAYSRDSEKHQLQRYQYQSLESGFCAELDVDDWGLVTRYPGLFERAT